MEPNVKLILDSDTKEGCIVIFAWHQVLTNASPYFRAMLSPDRFAEGTTLQNQKSLDLPLPETDPEAMQIICDILHLRSTKVAAFKMSPSVLHRVAVLVDRFDCSEAIRPWSQLWLEEGPIKADMSLMETMLLSMSDVSIWFRTCYALGFPQYLERHLSPTIVNTSAQDIASDDFHMPQSVLDIIVKKRHEVNECFVRIIDEQLVSSNNENTCTLADLEEDDWGISGADNNEKFHCSSITAGNTLLAIKTVLGEDWGSRSWDESIRDMHRRMYEFANKLVGPRWISAPSTKASKKKLPTHQACCHDAIVRRKIDDAMTELRIVL